MAIRPMNYAPPEPQVSVRSRSRDLVPWTNKCRLPSIRALDLRPLSNQHRGPTFAPQPSFSTDAKADGHYRTSYGPFQNGTNGQSLPAAVNRNDLRIKLFHPPYHDNGLHDVATPPTSARSSMSSTSSIVFDTCASISGAPTLTSCEDKDPAAFTPEGNSTGNPNKPNLNRDKKRASSELSQPYPKKPKSVTSDISDDSELAMLEDDIASQGNRRQKKNPKKAEHEQKSRKEHNVSTQAIERVVVEYYRKFHNGEHGMKLLSTNNHNTSNLSFNKGDILTRCPDIMDELLRLTESLQLERDSLRREIVSPRDDNQQLRDEITMLRQANIGLRREIAAAQLRCELREAVERAAQILEGRDLPGTVKDCSKELAGLNARIQTISNYFRASDIVKSKL